MVGQKETGVHICKKRKREEQKVDFGRKQSDEWVGKDIPEGIPNHFTYVQSIPLLIHLSCDVLYCVCVVLVSVKIFVCMCMSLCIIV